MPKRVIRPIYPHNGFVLRSVKALSNGAELLHCVERKTFIQCGALGRREIDGSISISKPHAGHMADDGKVKAKLARMEIKEIAQTSELAAKDILHVAKIKFGENSVIEAGSVSTISRMISRQRNKKCLDSEPTDSVDSVLQRIMSTNNDGEKCSVFDSTCVPINESDFASSSSSQPDIVEESKTVFSDDKFNAASSIFEKLWRSHAEVGEEFKKTQ